MDCSNTDSSMAVNVDGATTQLGNPRKKVLLSFVGNRDPHNIQGERRTEGGILSICAEIIPDIVYLFPSPNILSGGYEAQSATEGNADLVKRIYNQVDPECVFNIRPLCINDVTDFMELSVDFEKKIKDVIDELGGEGKLGEYDFHLNCSSGTQQMTAVGYVFANTGRIPQVRRWQVKDPDFATGKTRIKKIEVDIIEENNCIKKIKGNLEKLNYYSIRDDCARLFNAACSKERRRNALLLANLFDAYIELDMLNYSSANAALNRIVVRTLPDCTVAVIDQQKCFLKKMAAGGGKSLVDETLWNLTDLLFNMERSFIRGAYSDVLARFRRVVEGAAYFTLRTKFGINPRDVDRSPNCENKRVLSDTPGFHDVHGFIECKKACEAVRRLSNDSRRDVDYVKIINKNEKQRNCLMDKRNNSIIAHGMKPVSRTDVEVCFNLAKQFLTGLVPNSIETIRNYPFTKEKIQELVEILLD
jgi:hypothetical protein